MTIQQNYPNIRPSMSIDFAGTKQLDPRITYSRASTGTYYDGKTVAKAEENLLLQSQEFDQSPWDLNSTATVTANSTTAPDGTSTADTLFENANTSAHYVRTPTFSFVSGSSYAFSVFAKNISGGRGLIQIAVFAGFGSGANVTFNLATGAIAASTQFTGSITPVGNGWYRCVAVGTATSSVTERMTISLSDGTTTSFPSYAGDITKGIFIWGAQLEQRSFATAYTPTTTAPITNYIPVLQTASAGTPRFDHNPITGESLGLLIEEQRTNLLTYSSDFDNAAWTKNKTTVVSNTAVAPDGATTANLVYPNASGTSLHEVSINRFLGSQPTAARTNTIYVKAAGWRWVYFIDPAGSFNVWFDLQNGVVGTQQGNAVGKITSAGNGWFRIEIFRNQTAGIFYHYLAFSNADNSTVCTVSGTNGVLVWGAQTEAGAFATSYIPTALTYSGRASTGTFRAPNGLIQTAAINAPRYEVNAGGGSNLLLENASSNLLVYTENFDNAVWTKTRATVTANAIAAPDGNLTANKLVENTDTNSHFINQNATVSSGIAITYSIYAKKGERNYLSIFCLGTTAASNTFFDLSTGVVVSTSANATSSIQNIGNGWYRCTVTATTNATTTGIYPGISVDGVNASYTGNGTSGIFIWGAQLELGSTATSYIPSLETWTGRASTATYYDSTGIIRTAASGQPRYSYNPQLLSVAPKLLLEAQATNLLTFSEQFDDATWVKASSATVTANAIAAPNGLIAADLVTTTGGSSQVYQQQVLINGTYTFSVYVKRSTSDLFMLDLSDSSTGDAIVSYSLDNGTITSAGSGGSWSGTSGTIQNVGNGWYRCTLTATKGAGSSIIAKLQPTLGAGAFYLWGAQLETGSGATSYIPTVASQVTRVADTSTSAAQSRAADVYSSSQVTRAADSASMTGTNFSSWYNPSTSTVLASFDMLGVDIAHGATVFSIAASPAANGLLVYRGTNTANVSGYVDTGAASTGAIAMNVFQKVALAYDGVANGVVRNGSTVFSVGTAVSTPANKMTIGSNGTDIMSGHIQRIAYYPRRLTNTQLQALTT